MIRKCFLRMVERVFCVFPFCHPGPSLCYPFPNALFLDVYIFLGLR